MAEFFIDRETAEYEERRKARLARREEHLRLQRERERKIRRYFIIAGAGIGAAVLVSVIMLVSFSFIKYRSSASSRRPEPPSPETAVSVNIPGDARESLYDDNADTAGTAAQSAADGSGASPAMTELSAEELEAIEAEARAAMTTGAGPLELNTLPGQTTRKISTTVDSDFAILISLSDNQVLAERKSQQKMYPASMTKVLTVLVAAEHLEDETHLDDIYTMTREIESFSYSNGCSNVGFSPGERVRVEDLFYGTILPSGADAAMGLAEYTAGNQENFVAMMNEKARELGIGETSHFMNCVGLYDDNHYTTAADMAVIMNAAINNPLCLEFLSRHTYTTTPTSFHPGGITISNWFLRRIEDKMTSGVVLCGKTGFVKESLNCAVSYARDEEGKGYICCTGYGHGGWQVIRDHVNIYLHGFDPSLYDSDPVSENEAQNVEEEDDGGQDANAD